LTFNSITSLQRTWHNDSCDCNWEPGSSQTHIYWLARPLVGRTDVAGY